MSRPTGSAPGGPAAGPPGPSPKRSTSSSAHFRFSLNPSERVVVVGRTGSGKTTLARLLVSGYRSLVAIDPKHRLELPGAIVCTGIAEFRQTWPQRSQRVVFRPSIESDAELRNEVDEALARVFRYGRTAVFVDEALDLATSTAIVPAYRRLLRLGRELLIPVYSLSQRPMGLHNDVLSQSEHLFVFDLPLSGDRRKVADIGGDELMTRADLHHGREYGFAYYGPATRGRVLWIPPLNIGAAAAPPAPGTGGGGFGS